MKQTSVEWLVEQLDPNIMWTDNAKQLIDQAKQLEKEQIKHAYIQGCMDLVKSSEAYYNNQFKNKVEWNH